MNTPDTHSPELNAELRALPEGHIRHSSGAWKQDGIFKEPKVYDVEYVKSRYDTDRCDCRGMSKLRWECLLTHAELLDSFSLLDFGCGNGAFLREAQASRIYKVDVHGHDISGYPIGGIPLIPLEAVFEQQWDAVTFFDSIEHVDDIEYLLSRLRAKWLMVSVPWCHGPSQGVEWFNGWRHFRPDEHLWYFDAGSLCKLMGGFGYRPTFIGNPEDAIRKPGDGLPNILTGVFRKVDGVGVDG